MMRNPKSKHNQASEPIAGCSLKLLILSFISENLQADSESVSTSGLFVVSFVSGSTPELFVEFKTSVNIRFPEIGPVKKFAIALLRVTCLIVILFESSGSGRISALSLPA